MLLTKPMKITMKPFHSISQFSLPNLDCSVALQHKETHVQANISCGVWNNGVVFQ